MDIEETEAKTVPSESNNISLQTESNTVASVRNMSGKTLICSFSSNITIAARLSQ